MRLWGQNYLFAPTENQQILKGIISFFFKMLELFSGRCRWRFLTATTKGLFFLKIGGRQHLWGYIAWCLSQNHRYRDTSATLSWETLGTLRWSNHFQDLKGWWALWRAEESCGGLKNKRSSGGLRCPLEGWWVLWGGLRSEESPTTS